MKNPVLNPVGEINRVIADYKRDLDIMNAILPVLKKYDGKKPTKRLANDVSAALPEYTVSFGKAYSWYELSVWGNDIPYSSKFNLNLGYFSESPEFNYAKFFENGARRYLLNEERIAELERVLPDLESKISAYLYYKEATERAVANLGAAASFVLK